MNNRFLALIALVGINCLCSMQTLAVTKKFTGTDYSGVYACKGSNVKIGNYELVATFLMNKSNSRGNIGSYDLSIQTENATTYSGQAIANGSNLAITIKIVDGTHLAYSTGVASINLLKPKRYSYINQYYESHQTTSTSEIKHTGEIKSTGNYGVERCVMQKVKTYP